MSSTVAKSNGEKPHNSQAFSYAQAAKGRPAVPLSYASQASQSALSTPVSSSIKDANSTSSTSSRSSEREDRSVAENIDAQRKPEVLGEATGLDVKAVRSESAESPLNSPGFTTVSVSSTSRNGSRDDDFVLVEGLSEPLHEQDPKVKKNRRQKSGSFDVDKIEALVPAPLPAVNFWQVRKEKLAKTIPNQTSKSIKMPTESVTKNSVPHNLYNKNIDSKKRSKQIGTDGNDKFISSNQNGLMRDPIISGRLPRKGGNATSRFKEDQSSKRSATRIGRHIDKDDKSYSHQAPPPVEDASSWPTPEIALVGDKRKIQEKLERDEKEETVTNKPRQKEKWVPVPYIPTVTFSTPMPIRGGRSRGGVRVSRSDSDARSNHGPNGISSGEKLHTVTTGSVSSHSVADHQDAREGPNSSSNPTSRRRSTDVSNARKSSNIQFSDKTRFNHSRNDHQFQNEYHTSSRVIQSGQNSEDHRESRTHSENFNVLKHDQIQFSDPTVIGMSERRGESNLRHYDHGHYGKDANHSSRERVESRPDRGRGGFRGRGDYANYANGQPHSQSNFSNGTAGQHQNGYNIRQGPYSSPLVPPYNSQFAPPPRAGRVGPRSQSIPNSGMYGRFPHNSGGVAQQLASLQTSASMYDYTPLQPMSASSYQPYIDHISVHAMVTMQLEYYFSIDNLCKDVYLRKHMDSQGFVFLSFIAGFKRIQALTQDFELLRFACQESDVIELIRGDDGIDRLRRKEGWEKWVLTIEERDESTKNPGPSFWQPPQYAQKPQFLGQMVLTSPHPTCMMPYPISESGCPTHNNDGSIISSLNRSDAYQPPTPLSAAVPDFSPGLPAIDTSNALLEAETTFHEDEVLNLTLVFASPKSCNGDLKPRKLFTHASSRTFSNGSIDRNTLAEELFDLPLGEQSTVDGLLESESHCPRNPHSTTKSDKGNGPPVMWVKGQREQAPISEHNSQELYVTFRARALKNREITKSSHKNTHPDMKLLYEFWSHFLCRNFNSQIYTEFRQYALEDARSGFSDGIKNLISYYDEVLNSKKKVIPEILARHYVDLVESETSEDRPAYTRLRAAWRNGAVDLKSRKQVEKFLSTKLKEEFEQTSCQHPDLPAKVQNNI